MVRLLFALLALVLLGVALPEIEHLAHTLPPVPIDQFDWHQDWDWDWQEFEMPRQPSLRRARHALLIRYWFDRQP
jgi:hypothetical protein